MQQEAEVLARGRGCLTHEDLAPGDEILAYDPADDTARWEPVRFVHRFKVGGDLIRWRSKQIDVLTTPDHSWWTVGRSGPRRIGPGSAPPPRSRVISSTSRSAEVRPQASQGPQLSTMMSSSWPDGSSPKAGSCDGG